LETRRSGSGFCGERKKAEIASQHLNEGSMSTSKVHERSAGKGEQNWTTALATRQKVKPCRAVNVIHKVRRGKKHTKFGRGVFGEANSDGAYLEKKSKIIVPSPACTR